MSLQRYLKNKKFLFSIILLCFSALLYAGNSPKVKVGYFNFSHYQEGASDEERKSGYAYEYLQKIASYNGWEYEYIYGTRAALIEQFNEGKIDLFVGLSKEDIVSENCVFSLYPTIVARYYLFQPVKSNKLQLSNPETFIGTKIGIYKNTEGGRSFYDYVIKNNVKCEVIEFTNPNEFKAAFFNNQIDGFVSTDLELADDTYVSVVDKLGEHSLFAAITTTKPELYDQFSNAQESIKKENPLYIDLLHNKYFSEKITNHISDKKDFSWLKKNNTIRIGYIEDYLPFCGLGRKGEMEGLLVDLLGRFDSSELYKTLNIIYEPYAEYPDAMKGLMNGDVDVLFPFFGDLWFSEQHKFHISDQVYSLNMVMISDRKSDFKEYKTIAASKRSPLQIFYINAYFPDYEVIYFDSFEDCVNAVTSNKADFTLANNFKATYYINTHSAMNLDIKELQNECPISFAVRQGNTELLNIINASLSRIDNDFRTNSVYMNSYDIRTLSLHNFITQNAALFLGILIIVIFIIVIISYYLINKTRKRNFVVRSQKEQLEKLLRQERVTTATIRSVSKMYIALYYINMNDYAFTEMYVSDPVIRESIGQTGNAIIKFDSMNKDLVTPDFYDTMCKFNDLSTLKERLGDRQYISQDFRGPHFGWCEAFFIVSDRNTSNNLSQVIYAVRSIEKEKELLVRSNTDELTGCLNRRSYEDDIKELSKEVIPEDLIIVSLDLNGLKNANDDIGHDAGDELIIGAAQCIEKAFGPYGKVYRIGGDEFIACINASEKQYEEIQDYFEGIVEEWHGTMLDNLSISYGAASAAEFTEKSITEIAKLSDKRMYENKEHFYSKKGIDRRTSQAAFEALKITYSKIIKINLKTDEYSIMLMDDSERSEIKGFSNTITDWIHSFANSGCVHPEDKEKYLERTNLEYMKEYFSKEQRALTIRYRRLDGDIYRDTVMDIIPAGNYSESNQVVFLYVKILK